MVLGGSRVPAIQSGIRVFVIGSGIVPLRLEAEIPRSLTSNSMAWVVVSGERHWASRARTTEHVAWRVDCALVLGSRSCY